MPERAYGLCGAIFEGMKALASSQLHFCVHLHVQREVLWCMHTSRTMVIPPNSPPKAVLGPLAPSDYQFWAFNKSAMAQAQAQVYLTLSEAVVCSGNKRMAKHCKTPFLNEVIVTCPRHLHPPQHQPL